MDRDDSDQIKLSLNFADFIVIPLFKKLLKLFSGLDIPFGNLLQNRERWSEAKWSPKKESTTAIKPNIVDMSFQTFPSSSGQPKLAALPKIPKKVW